MSVIVLIEDDTGDPVVIRYSTLTIANQAVRAFNEKTSHLPGWEGYARVVKQITHDQMENWVYGRTRSISELGRSST